MIMGAFSVAAAPEKRYEIDCIERVFIACLFVVEKGEYAR